MPCGVRNKAAGHAEHPDLFRDGRGGDDGDRAAGGERLPAALGAGDAGAGVHADRLFLRGGNPRRQSLERARGAGARGTLVAWVPYMLTVIVMAPRYSTYESIGAGLLVFFVCATAFLLLTQHYGWFR